MNSQGTPEERVVQTGVFNDSSVQILEGLEVSENVLLNPPLLTESSAEAFQQALPELMSEQGKVDSMDIGAGSQDVRGAGRSREGRQGEGMPAMTEEQMRQFKEKFGSQGKGGMPALTEEQMKQFREKFGNRQEGGSMPGMTEEQRKQLREKFGSGGSGGGGRGTRRQNRTEQPAVKEEETSTEN